MRRKLNILLIAALSVVSVGCEDYLDKAPESGLSEDSLYASYESILGVMDVIFYNVTEQGLVFHHDRQGYNNGSALPGCFSDEYISVRNGCQSLAITSGNWLSVASSTFEIGSKDKTMIARAYGGLRTVNRVIKDIDRVVDITEEEKRLVLGQAHFLRAHFYFDVIKRYGGMPLLDNLIGAADDFNIPRKTYQESNEWMQTDLDKAIDYLPEQWDDRNYGRPSKIAAQALKAMTQLYAASPLMQNGLDALPVDNGYDKEMAKEAAVSAQKAIDLVNKESTFPAFMETNEATFYDDYRKISIHSRSAQYLWPTELIWFPVDYPDNSWNFIRGAWLTAPYEPATGTTGAQFNAPSQNMVDLFERKGTDGKYYPISDPRSGYTEAIEQTDIYSNRDPRLKCNIIVPGEQFGVKGTTPYYQTMYVGGYADEYLKNNQFTNAAPQPGYMCKKFLWESANAGLTGSNSGYTENWVMAAFIRVAQCYLDLAEASFEATGDPDAKVDGCSLSARQALNIVRNRGGIGDLPDGVDFREAYRRERAIELMFEGHRWFDIRRWMIAVDLFSGASPMKGIHATPLNHSYTATKLKAKAACAYKFTEFSYEIFDIPSSVRVFNTRNYWYPLPMDEVAAFTNLKQNPGW